MSAVQRLDDWIEILQTNDKLGSGPVELGETEVQRLVFDLKAAREELQKESLWTTTVDCS